VKVFFTAIVACFFGALAGAQELYPYSEPASNMPAQSISVKLGAMLMPGNYSNRVKQRYMPEVMFGLDKRLMVHASVTASDMHRDKLIFESVRLYGKYRFLSVDQVHKHFRMAAFGAVAYSRNDLFYNEINLMGDHSGFQGGLIATQLWNKFALSATGSWNEVLNRKRRDKAASQYYAFQSVNYSLSAGYLLLPFEYKDYNQTNVNLYAELLGSRNIFNVDDKYWVDLAPSVQFIFKSTGKLNLGCRFQVAGDIYRLSRNGFMVGYEHIFLNALNRKSRHQTL
jgi:hypothetical protein